MTPHRPVRIEKPTCKLEVRTAQSLNGRWDYGIDLHSTRFKRDDDGKLTDVLLSYDEREETESENGNPQSEGERK